MEFLGIKIKTITSTFRNIEFLNFHKSYKLPPPLTVVGLAGSAMGVNPLEAQSFFEENSIYIGIYGKSTGLAKDLWKFRTFKKNGEDIILKEILFDNNFYIVFGSDKSEAIRKLQEAFTNPKFALFLGNNDNIAKIVDIFSPSYDRSRTVEYCIIKGNIIDKVLETAKINKLDFSIYTKAEPIVYSLPIRFDYKKGPYSFRTVKQRAEFSFVAEAMQLNFEVEGVRLENQIFVPIFKF